MPLKSALFQTVRTTPTTPPIRFQILSGLHLEVGQQYETFIIPPKAPYLILAGNIGRLIDYEPFRIFLAAQCSSFTRLFLILGDLEFHGTSHAEGRRAAEILFIDPIMNNRLTILDRERFDLDGNVTVVGCSLTYLMPSEIENVVKMTGGLGHVHESSVGARNLEYDKDLYWLRKQVSRIRGEAGPRKRLLVVTHPAHFADGGNSPSNKEGHGGTAFETNVLGIVEGLGPGDCWAVGYSRFCMEGVRKGVRVFANQGGCVMPNVVSFEKKEAEESGGFWRKVKASLSRADERKEFDVEKIISV